MGNCNYKKIVTKQNHYGKKSDKKADKRERRLAKLVLRKMEELAV